MKEQDRQQITIKSTVNQPVEVVWESWKKPEHIMKWNQASEDWHTVYAENDLKVGGRFLSRMEAKDGSTGFDFSGTYEMVEPYETIAYELEDSRKVLITFEPFESQTEIVQIFDAENENPAEMQREGWQAILNQFKQYTEEQL
ncbi:SRPBCC domain-containing protein [Marinilactibacillus piezotolerans]|uniref:SRPBCC domain-containing protein n=1 Tax=Marinilactibacillus piezotolerans TaxID=258723 RepID=UPI0009B0139D|nr:SRPBCC domain-containing protein [Marinilactibacillus piezotolerans]